MANSEKSFEERARELVSQMTLEEKATQTLFNSPAIPRLGIPAYNWWNEALHGVARAGVATVFPQAIGLAAAFDKELMSGVAQVISTEARAKHNVAVALDDRDIYKGLTFWSPNVNIFRDPRWGRGHETYGEDPYLTSELGKAFVNSLQGDGPVMKAAACAKHFAVHSGPEGIRHEFDAISNEKDLHETYLPAFKALVEEAKVEAVMGAYNRTNGEPCCGSKKLLVDILRDEWGFSGHVTSDCWAIKDFHEHHHVTVTAPESAALAMNNGCDLNCGVVYLHLLQAHKDGLVKEEAIDKAVIRLYVTRMKLGFFDESNPWADLGAKDIDTPENVCINEGVSEKTLVLLKNSGILPLVSDKVSSIAIIGPNADSVPALEGNYCGTSSDYITVLRGIRELAAPDCRIYYSQGCHIHKEKTEGLSAVPGDRFSEAVGFAKASDIAIVCLGLDANLEGEEGDTSNSYASGDKPNLKLPGLQEELLKYVIATGTPTIVVNLSGSAIDLSYAEENAKAVIQAWYPGAQGGRAVAGLLFGKFSPSGKLPVTFYRDQDQLPEFTDYSMDGRTYRYIKGEPLYPFGYGLSYTDISFSGIEAPSAWNGEGKAVVKATVKNEGNLGGREIAQIYISRPEAPDRFRPAPIWSLKSFQTVELAPGESKTVEFELGPESFSLFDKDGNQELVAGKAVVYLGGTQPDARSVKLAGKEPLKAEIEITGEAVLRKAAK